MKLFLNALQFLTILPLRTGSCENREMAGSLMFFPVAGMLIGSLAWLALSACARLDLGAFAYAIVPVITLAALTGGLHLDGLCDTADALMSGKDRNGMLAVMRDPHAGALGIVALVCVILAKIAFVAAVPLVYRGPALILACVAGRWPLVLSLSLFPYARTEGKAAAFSSGVNGKILLAAGGVAVACAIAAAGMKGLIVLAVITLFVCLFDIRISRKIGGITGDTLGASTELAETGALLLAAFIF